MRETVKLLLSADVLNREVSFCGWIRTRRDSKGFSFLEVNDGTSQRGIQVVVPESCASYGDVMSRGTTGAAVEVKGVLVQSPGKEQSIEVSAKVVYIVGDSPSDQYPLQKKRHTNEFLRTIAHLRPRTNTFGAVFRLRSHLSFAVHKFFIERGFYYVHTPIITTADCEGGGEMFKVTTFNLENVPRLESGDIDFSVDFFSKQAGLTVSGQLEGETAACALGSIYTFGPTFRAENSNTPRHLAEFWMIEPEMAFCDLQGDMAVAQDFTKYLIKSALDGCQDEMSFFNSWVEPCLIDSLASVANANFEHMTYTEAISILQKSGKSFQFPIDWGCELQTEHERYLTDDYVKGPVFVTDYPRDIKAFYMRQNEDGRTVSAMDLLVPRLGEIIGGSQREERLDCLERRMQELGLDVDNYWWYLDLRRFGSVPHAGFGLGFERMIMYVTGMSNIRDVIPFPRTPGHAEF